MAVAISGQEQVGFSPQTSTIGNAVRPHDSTGGILVPVLPGTFKATENFEQILDNGRRTGRDSMDFKAYQGVGWTEISWDGYLCLGRAATSEPKTGIGYLLMNLLGADGVVNQIASTAAYEHRLILGTGKGYLTVEYSPGGGQSKTYVGCRVGEIRIRWNNGEGAVEYSVSMIGRVSTDVSFPAGTFTDHTNDAWLGYQCKSLVNGVGDIEEGSSTYNSMISGEWTLTRELIRHYGGSESQNYTDIYAGPLEAICSVVLDYNGEADVNAFQTKAQGSFATSFRTGTMDAADEKTFAIGSAKADLGDGPLEIDNSNANMRVALTARMLDTTASGPFDANTNSATAQNGPIQIQIIQQNSTIYDLNIS